MDGGATALGSPIVSVRPTSDDRHRSVSEANGLRLEIAPATEVNPQAIGYPIPVLDEGVPDLAAVQEPRRDHFRAEAEVPGGTLLGRSHQEHQLCDIKLVSDASLAALDLDDLLPLLLDRVLDLLRSDTAAVLLYDAAS